VRAVSLALAAFFVWSGACLAHSAPLEIAGIKLGADKNGYEDKIDAVNHLTDISHPYVTVAAIKPVPGFRSGYVAYGNCVDRGRIVRVKMNYEDGSKDFFEKILAALKKRYGEPREWRGNPFGSLRVWKWTLADPALGEISMVLQHYTGDDESFTRGNSIRIGASRLLKAEQECYRAARPAKTDAPKLQGVRELGLDHFLPR
jgi:hypothetical protein